MGSDVLDPSITVCLPVLGGRQMASYPKFLKLPMLNVSTMVRSLDFSYYDDPKFVHHSFMRSHITYLQCSRSHWKEWNIGRDISGSFLGFNKSMLYARYVMRAKRLTCCSLRTCATFNPPGNSPLLKHVRLICNFKPLTISF